MSNKQKNQSSSRPRSWYWDAFAAAAFFGQTIFLGKIASRTLGPFAGLFVVLINGGLAWFFARSAWRGLMERK